jgi:hypothetical protein
VTSPWWAAFELADTEVSCGAASHRVRWTDGTLSAVDHPDAEGELVLAALGGDATPCLDLVRTWGLHCDDLAVLAIGPRSAEDKLTITTATLDESTIQPWPVGSVGYGPGLTHRSQIIGHRGTIHRASSLAAFRSAGFAGMTVGGPRAGSAPMRAAPPWAGPRPLAASLRMAMRGKGDGRARAELLRLLALGAPFQWRLSAAVAHAWSADGQHAGHRGRADPALTAALTGRLAPAVAQWLGIDPGQVEASIHDGDGWGEVESVISAAERRLRAKLPVSWLARVWAPGLAVVGGHLVVSVQHAEFPVARVLAVRAPGGDAVELSIRRDRQHWSIAG